MRRLAGLGGVLLALAWVTCLPAPAQAHALLVASSPGDGESVDPAPTELLLTFTEVPDLVLSIVHVVDASGKQVEADRPAAVPGQPTRLRVPLDPMAKGSYTVTWRTTSAADGHTTAGSVSFGVGVPAVAPGAEGTSAAIRSPTPTPVSVVGRWLFYAGVVLLLGAAVVGVFVVADPQAIPRAALTASWVLSAVGLVLTIADQRATAQTGMSQLLRSSTGHKLTLELGAVALAGLAVLWAGVRRRRSSLVLVGAAAAAVMLARALAGHADASSARWFTVSVQWAHLVSVGAWVGGLVWLLVAIRRRDPGQGGGLAKRFSSMAAVTLAVVALSGTARAVNLVGAWNRLLDTSFGVTLLVKIGLFVVLVALGARSRFRHVPAAATAGATGLRRAVRGEVALAAAVLAATAVLAGLPPSTLLAAASRTPPIPTVTVNGNDVATSVRVRLVVTPGLPGPNRFDAAVVDYGSNQPVPAQSVSLNFQSADRPDVAPATLDLTRDPDTHWRAFGRPLSFDGRWKVTATVQTPTDAVEVPMDLVPRKAAIRSTPSGGQDAGTCGDGKPDDTYTVTVESEPNPPKLEGTILHLTVRQSGRLVTGAKACFGAGMPEMQHPDVSRATKEGAPGRYDADLKFSMAGSWVASLVVAEPGKPVVVITFKLQVT